MLCLKVCQDYAKTGMKEVRTAGHDITLYETFVQRFDYLINFCLKAPDKDSLAGGDVSRWQMQDIKSY